MNRFYQYINDVKSGAVLTNEYMKKVMRRHDADMKRDDIYFSESHALDAINFIELLEHVQGKLANPALSLDERRIHLEPWQVFLVGSIFGWRRKSDGMRRFRRAYVEIAKKNGKTLLAAAIACYMFYFDGEYAPEVLFGAATHDQADIGFKAAKAMIDKSGPLSKLSKYRAQKNRMLKNAEPLAKMMPISSEDSQNKDGYNVHCGIIDEYHAHKDTEIYDIVYNGMAARDEPLLFVITTAGFNLNYPCFTTERPTAIRAIEGVKKLDDYFSVIYTLDKEDDWRDIKNAIKANPNLGISVSTDFVQSQINTADEQKRKLSTVLTKHMNRWVYSSESWINTDQWIECETDFDMDSLKDCDWYGGIDLSKKHDLSAYTLTCFHDGRYYQKHHFWLPKEGIDEKQRNDKVEYRIWADDGFITLTEGNVIDYDEIKQYILDLHTNYNIVETAYDKAFSVQIIPQLQNELGPHKFVEFSQGAQSMNPACLAFEEKIENKTISTYPTPIMRWMISCAHVKTNYRGEIFPVKPDIRKSSSRIDGVITSIMSLQRCIIGNNVKKTSFLPF